MSRSPRIQFEGALYHVTARGNDRRTIFLDDRDRTHFLQRLREAVDMYDVRLHLFCLMANHFHLLVETPAANLSRFMQALLTSHAMYFNLRHEHVGHLFQGRFGARLVSKDDYLLRLTRYIHLNPAFAAYAKSLSIEDRMAVVCHHPWSSCPGYVDRSNRVAFVRYDPVLEMVSGGRRRPEQAYRRYLEEGLARTDKELRELLQSKAPAIGSAEFQQTAERDNVTGQQRHATAQPAGFGGAMRLVGPERVLKVVAKAFGQSAQRLRRRQRDCRARAVAAMMLCRYARQTQLQAATWLGLGNNAAVSIQLRKLQRELLENAELRKKLNAIEGTLRNRV